MKHYVTIGEYLKMSDSAKRELLDYTCVNDILDELVRADIHRRKPGELRFRPSDIGTMSDKVDGYAVGCPRLLFFSYLGYPRLQMDPHSQKRVDVGTAIHGLVEKYLEQGISADKVRAAVEVPTSKLLFDGDERSLIKGVADGLLFIGPAKVVIEFKSVSLETLYKMSGPKDDHQTQLHNYMWAFDSPVGSLVYITIDNQMIWDSREWGILWDPHRWEAVKKRVSEVLQHLKKGTIPPRGGNDYWCRRFCGYRHICKFVDKYQRLPSDEEVADVAEEYQTRTASRYHGRR